MLRSYQILLTYVTHFIVEMADTHNTYKTMQS